MSDLITPMAVEHGEPGHREARIASTNGMSGARDASNSSCRQGPMLVATHFSRKVRVHKLYRWTEPDPHNICG